MHSKHHPNPHHTMSTTYKPRFRSPPTYPRLSTHQRPSTWSEHHAALILSLRDVSSPPTKTPDPDVRDFDVNRQIHARWTDPGIVDAMVGALRSVASKANALHFPLVWIRWDGTSREDWYLWSSHDSETLYLRKPNYRFSTEAATSLKRRGYWSIR